jgi:hypothetical protein
MPDRFVICGHSNILPHRCYWVVFDKRLKTPQLFKYRLRVPFDTPRNEVVRLAKEAWPDFEERKVREAR